jgi:hypothetical protein
MNFMKMMKQNENGVLETNGHSVAVASIDQLKSANEIKRELHPAFVYIPCALVILVLLFSDGMAVAKSLTSGYGFIAYFLAFGVIGSIDMAYLGALFCFKQLFALRQLSYTVWLFYLLIGAMLGIYGFFAGMMVVNHIDALGIKQRRILAPYDYSNNPALIAAQEKVEELRGQVNSADKTIFAIAKTVEHTSKEASAMSASLRAVSFDTMASREQRRNMVFYTGRANKSSAGTVSTLASMQKERNKLATALVGSMDDLDAVNDSLVARYAGKSAEDVVEADMGMELKRTVAKMTQFGVLAAMFVMLVFRYAYKGEALYYPIKFKPSRIDEPAKNESSNLAVNEHGKLVEIELMKPKRPDQFKAGSREEAKQWLYWRTLVGEIIKGTKTESGDLSYALRHGSLPKTMKPSLWRQIGKAEKFMRENTAEEVERIAVQIEQKYGFKMEASADTLETVSEFQVMPEQIGALAMATNEI